MANRQNTGNSSQSSTHVENDNSATANSSSVPTAAPAAAASPSSGASAAQTETAVSSANQAQDAPQTQSPRPQITTQGRHDSTEGICMWYTFSQFMDWNKNLKFEINSMCLCLYLHLYHLAVRDYSSICWNVDFIYYFRPHINMCVLLSHLISEALITYISCVESRTSVLTALSSFTITYCAITFWV
jgi:hypothetical protein